MTLAMILSFLGFVLTLKLRNKIASLMHNFLAKKWGGLNFVQSVMVPSVTFHVTVFLPRCFVEFITMG